jgi:outer membrane protein assembly factor BamD
MRLVFILGIFWLALSSCSWMPFVDSEEEIEAQERELYKGFSENQFYERIQKYLQGENWSDAITSLQAYESQFPFGNYAEQAQLELIYAYYQSLDYEAATAAAERFIRLHPRHDNVDYAFYIKALAGMVQSKGMFSDFIPLDESRRDVGEARRAFATFSELVNQYPNSSYAADSQKRMLHLRNILARQEIHIANYYFKRGAYLSAANRGRFVVENFQQSPAVPDGLAVMAQAYYMMGLRDLANDAALVLASNYSNHPSLDEQGSFAFQEGIVLDEEGWLSRISFGYFKQEKPPRFDSRALYNPIDRSLSDRKSQPPAGHAPSEPAPTKRSWLSRITFGLLG